MAPMRDRRVLTRHGELWLGVWVSSSGYVAESLDRELSAFAATEGEAVARLIAAVEASETAHDSS